MHYPKGKSHIVREYAEAHGIPIVDIPLSKLEEVYEEQLPEWAYKKADKNVIECLQQLITRFPHQRGNATVIEVVYLVKYCEIQFIVGTDAGNIMKLSINELYEMYELGDYILKDLPNPKLYEKLEEMGE